MLSRRMAALEARDAHAFMGFYAPRFTTFELGPPLQYLDGDPSNTSGVELWLESFEGPVKYEIRDLRCRSAGDLAYCHSLYRMIGTKVDGTKVDFWARQTLGLVRIGGEWKIEHSHLSAPFEMDGDNKAALDLKP